MATLTIKNLPDGTYRQLKESASMHRRSINGEAIVCLERVLGSERVDPQRFLEEVRLLRSRLPDVQVSDEELRSARNEGRP